MLTKLNSLRVSCALVLTMPMPMPMPKHKAHISLAKLYNLMVSHLNNDISPVFSAFFPLYLLSKNHDLVRAAQRMSIKFQLKPIARALVQMIFRSNLLFFFSLHLVFDDLLFFFAFVLYVCSFVWSQTNYGWLTCSFIFRLVTGVHLHLYTIKTTLFVLRL